MKKSSGSNKQSKNSVARYEAISIKRLRTNSAEFAQTVRGYFNDINTSGVGAQAYSVFLNYPSYYRNAAGTIAQTGVVTGLLAQEQKVFDEYKCTRLKVTYLSYVTGQVRVAYVAASAAAGAPSTPLFVMGTDLDDSALWTTSAKAISSQNPAIFNRFDPKGMRTCVMRQVDSLEKQKWLNLGAIIPSTSAPPDPNNPAKLSCVKLWNDGYVLTNVPEALIMCEWTVLFKGSYTLV